jgi:hypothetical protein
LFCQGPTWTAKSIQHEVVVRQQEQVAITQQAFALNPVRPETALNIQPLPAHNAIACTAQQRPPSRKSKRYYRKPLPDEQMERLAQQVHRLTNTHSDRNIDGLSIFNARRLVETYGVGPAQPNDLAMWAGSSSRRSRVLDYGVPYDVAYPAWCDRSGRRSTSIPSRVVNKAKETKKLCLRSVSLSNVIFIFRRGLTGNWTAKLLFCRFNTAIPRITLV